MMFSNFKNSVVLFGQAIAFSALIISCSEAPQSRLQNGKEMSDNEDSVKETDRGELNLDIPDLDEPSPGQSGDQRTAQAQAQVPPKASLSQIVLLLCPASESLDSPSEKCLKKASPAGRGRLTLRHIEPGAYKLRLTIFSREGDAVMSGDTDVKIEAGKVAVADLSLEPVKDSDKGGLIVRIHPPKRKPEVAPPVAPSPGPTAPGPSAPGPSAPASMIAPSHR